MSNILESKIKKIIGDLQSMYDEDPARIEQLDTITNLLLEDEKQTIDFLKNCDNEQVIFWIATSLDEVASKFPSNELLSVLKSLSVKFSGNKMLTHNFQMAIDSI